MKWKDITYTILSGISCVFLVYAYKYLIGYLNLLSSILNRAIDKGMSLEFQLIFILAILYVVVKIFTLLIISLKDYGKYLLKVKNNERNRN